MRSRGRSTNRLRKIVLWTGTILVGAVLGLQLNSILTVAAPLASVPPVLSNEPVTTQPVEPTQTPATETSAPALPDPSPTAASAPSIPPTPPSARPTPVPTPRSTPAPTPSAAKVIVVSLERQSLTAYEGGKPVLSALVATGRPALPTPRGTFHIMAKYSPYQFISPWPKSSPYWYASAWVKYALLFANDGYFLHDAPWRTVYGPGANSTNGTHGCVNIPLDAMTFLYRWAPVGTTVVVN